MKENKELDNLINNAKELGSYFITVTTLDKSKNINNLTHSISREEFPIEDVVPSLDNCVRLLGIRQSEMADVVVPKRIEEDRRKLKIGILSHFRAGPDSFSPAKATKNQIILLKKFGHSVTLFLPEGSTMEAECEIKRVLPNFKREKNIINEEVKNKYIEVLKKEITPDFDIILTQDLLIDDCATIRQSIMECGINVEWCHTARSGIGHKINFYMPNARYIYMNFFEARHFADMISVPYNKIRVSFNEKEPSLFFKWNPITTMICNKMDLYNKDIIQTYAICSTRMDAKNINQIINIFGLLKKKGEKVALIICNSNGRHRQEDIQNKLKYALEQGLTDKDIVFTSTLANEEFDISREVPNIVVSQLTQISNLFIFGSMAEVSPNILLEAAISKNLIVCNDDLRLCYDFIDENNCLSFPFGSNNNMSFNRKYDELVNKIIEELERNKANRSFLQVLKNNSINAIYYNMLEPILYERIKD